MRSVTLPTRRGYRLALRLYPGNRNLPLVILCHGLGVDSRYPLIATIQKELTKAGFGVCVFDLAAHGNSSGGVKDRLVRNFVSDLVDCIAYCKKNDLASNGVALIGHSIGALASMIVASQQRQNIACVVCIAGNAEAKKKQLALEAKGKIRTYKTYSMVGRTKVAKNFWIDRSRLEPKQFVRKIQMPMLYVDGSKDHTNPPEDSRLLLSWTKSKRKKVVLIAGADHYFKPLAHQTAAAKTIQLWLKKNIL